MSTYVYAVVHASHPLPDEPPPGIGEPSARVRFITEGDLGAVVSDAPEGLRAKRRDLMAHQTLLGSLLSEGAVLPMRFGSVAQDDDAVRAVLAERGEHFTERLRELDGRVEFNVKAAHHEDEMLRRVIAREPRIRELNERTRQTGDQQDRLRLGELVAEAVRAQEERDAELVREALSPLAEADSEGPGMRDCLCNYSFLVDGSGVEAFREAVSRLEREQPHLELSAHGPIPPYSFVEPVSQSV